MLNFLAQQIIKCAINVNFLVNLSNNFVSNLTVNLTVDITSKSG